MGVGIPILLGMMLSTIVLSVRLSKGAGDKRHRLFVFYGIVGYFVALWVWIFPGILESNASEWLVPASTLMFIAPIAVPVIWNKFHREV